MSDSITRPGFDFITMVTEWRDYLKANGYTFAGKQGAGLLSTLVSRHMTLFRMDLVQMGLLWDELKDAIVINPCSLDAIERGYIDRPTREVIDLAWLDSFDVVAEDLDDIVAHLYQSGEL